MEKQIRVLALLVVVLAVAGSLPAQAQRQPIARPQPVQAKDKLHEMAKKSGGHFVMRFRPNRSTFFPNVEELAKRSDVIVVGRTLGHRSTLRPDGNFITQDFLVRVQEVIKGDVANGRSITISLPGGSYMFPDKTLAVVTLMGQQPTEDQMTYVFFLKSPKKDSHLKGHVLVSENQGMFAVKNGKVQPSDLARYDPIVVKYQQVGAADFLKEIHKAVPRKERKEEATGK